jgi:hypothetical protein
MDLRKVVALKWRNLLGTPEGVEGMAYLRHNAPSIPAADSTSIVFHAGRNQGYVECLNDIMEMAKAEDKVKPDEDLLNKGLQ